MKPPEHEEEEEEARKGPERPVGGRQACTQPQKGGGGEGNGVQGQSRGARGCGSCGHRPPCCCDRASVRGMRWEPGQQAEQ